MSDLQIAEIKYCMHCGSVNKASATVCCECEKKIRNSYRPFYDFLKKHTKDDISGKVTDTLFSCLKRFLMSHIYGMVLSVTIVAAAVSTVYSAQPYVERIDQADSPVVVDSVAVNEVNEVAQEEPALETKPLSNDDLYRFEHLTSNYDSFVDALRSSEPYWDTAQAEYGSASEMYAENNITGFSYGGIHEMMENPISMPDFYNDSRLDELSSVYYASDRYSDSATAVSGEKCTSEVAKRLLSDGYRVAECNYVLIEYAGETDYDFNSHSGKGFMEKLVYKLVYVEHEGNWYIADDRLVEHISA